MSQVIQEPLLKEVTLRVMGERATLQQVSLHDGASIMIGSGANCGIRLNSMRISSIHCLLQLTDSHLMLQDWCSMLGTTVNGNRVEEQCELQVGDVIRLGEFSIEVAAAGSAKRSNEGRSDSASNSIAAKPPAAPSPTPAAHASSGSTDVLADQASSLGGSPSRTTSSLPQMAADLSVATDVSLGEPSSTPFTASASEPTGDATSRLAGEAGKETVQTVVPGTASVPPGVSTVSAPQSSQLSQSTANGEKPRTPTPVARPVVKVRPTTPDNGSLDRHLDPWGDDTVALLQAELETLQAELRDRDQELRDLRSTIVQTDLGANDNRLDQEQSEALVARLEDLLDELGRSDQRALALEDLLRAEQERATAEQEERQQIEEWLGGIEQRLSDRESEWVAERKVLQGRLEQFRTDREQLDRQMHDQATSDQERAMAQMVQDLRGQLDLLQHRLDGSEQARLRLEQQLEAATSKSSEELARNSVEDAVREERLRLAQERAALSRDRAELARRLAEVEDSRHGKSHCEADERFNALRQTLKETRDKEPETPVRKPSLGARLADLWRRLDGPTDTD